MSTDLKWWRATPVTTALLTALPRWLDRANAYPGVVLAKKPGNVRLFRDLEALEQQNASLAFDIPRMMLDEVEAP